MTMSTMNISQPEMLKSFVDDQVGINRLPTSNANKLSRRKYSWSFRSS